MVLVYHYLLALILPPVHCHAIIVYINLVLSFQVRWMVTIRYKWCSDEGELLMFDLCSDLAGLDLGVMCLE